MRILSLLLILYAFLATAYRVSQSPHGPDFKIGCNTCHSTKGWQLDKEIYSFDHNKTGLPLAGQHTALECRNCHTTLIFSQAKSNCIDCHSDVHQLTAGPDCSRCHTPVSWLVSNITDIHRMSRFPLLGAHRSADCFQCHKAENPVRFDITGVNCIDCHRNEFLSTTAPDHSGAGFSEECTTCHNVNAYQWEGAGFNHSFFPLTSGHGSLTCLQCHTAGNYSAVSPECSACHTADYNSTTNPSHQTLNFSLTCKECHTTDPGWKPAEYRQHDALSFPIYSGVHNNRWDSCTDCHSLPSNYNIFTCIICHEHNKTETDNEHKEVGGYTYTATSCLTCHPDGRSND